jgi:GT2 family glycosyltransferase
VRGAGREEAAGPAPERRCELLGPSGDGAPRDELDAPARAGATVVVATLGRPRRIAAVVDAALADPATMEVVVVVDGPDVDSARVLADLAATRPRLRHLLIEHRGHLGALQAGVEVATCDVVVLLDDDVVPHPGTISGHLAHHAGGGRLVVMGSMPVAPAPGRRPSLGTRLYAAEYLAHLGRIESGALDVLDGLWAGNLSMRRADVLGVRLNSPGYAVFYHSDRELGFRMRAAGVVGLFDRSLRADHVHTRSDAEFLRDAGRQGEGRVELHRAHGARLGPFRLTELVDDLPAPLRLAVAAVGSVPVAPRAAAAIMAAGRALGRVGRDGAPMVAAKLARRVMQWHGARRRLAAATGDARAGTPAPRPT